MLRLTDISVRLGGFGLELASLQTEPGEYLVILGPNGAGKTVLLEAVAGLHPLSAGRIDLHDGADWADVSVLPPEKRMIGFVYQDYLLFPHLSVAGNIGFGLRGRMAADDRAARVREAAALTGIEALLPRRVTGLSGGEQQKVALARALAIRPRLLLLDEPLAALDRTARREMAHEIRRLCGSLGQTVIHVTHSLDEAVSLGDRVAVLVGGRLLQIDTPAELLRRPVDRIVAALVGCENLLPGVAGGGEVAIAGGPVVPARDPVEGPVTVALRAEDLTLGPYQGPAPPEAGVARFAGVVSSLEPGPAHWTVRVQCAGERSAPAAAARAVAAAGPGTPAPAAPATAAAPATVFKVFIMPPELARLALTVGSPVTVTVAPERVQVFSEPR